jgi:Tfp pilus assembly protein PilF
MEKRQGSIMSIQKVVTGFLLAGLLIAAFGCNETHAQKKKAMVEQWEQSTAQAQLPLAENMIEQGRIEEAKETLIESIQTNPEMPEAFVLIGRVPMTRLARRLKQRLIWILSRIRRGIS